MSLLTALGISLLVVVNVAITVVATRFFRLQLETQWAAAIYALLFVPLVLLVSTVVLSGLFGVGEAAGGRAVAVTIAVVLPMAIGFAIDLFWMPAPAEIDLPDTR